MTGWICSTVACGTCSYCRAGYYAQCDNANPHGPSAGTSFFGGPAETGPVNGLQAERARIPFAATTMVKLPDQVSDEQAILISDIIGVYPPTAQAFPIGQTMNKNLSINAGNCNHRAYIPKLIEMVRMGRIDPVQVLTKVEPITDAIAAYEHFDRRDSGWIKTELLPRAAE